MIKVKGRDSWTLFDSGARRTYVVPEVAAVLNVSEISQSIRTALGGGVQETNQLAVLEANIEGYPISTHAMVLDHIGRDEEGKPIEVLIGALVMQEWGIRLIPEQEKLDMSYYPKEFVEF
jgi:hypothetical protein